MIRPLAATRPLQAAAAWLSTLAPGLALVLVVALVARGVGRVVPPVLNEVILALVCGLLVANVLGVPASARPGIRFAVQRILRLGIILLGARLSLGEVLTLGGQALGVVLALMTIALLFAYGVGRLLGLPRRLALLIGVGTAVCGNSAIIATAPIIEAEERDVSFAVATITLFGTLAVLLYPLVGLALALSQPVFGFWAGSAINDTSQVVAASAAYGAVALTTATVVKLTRNALMAPLLLAIAWWWRRQAGVARRGAAGAVPLFVLGFLLLVLLRTLGLVPATLLPALDEGARFGILLALTGVGLSTSLRSLRQTGLTPLLVGLATALLIAVLSLGVVSALHPA
ncbi:MAG: putative sulfate exporter family transporter [Chloroflexi bacterium]|nr:putative sulfate exporter family transporter [Chloroflexota bacterium]